MPYHQFQNGYGETYGSFETFQWDRFDCQDADLIEQDQESETGWSTTVHGIAGFCQEDVNPADYEGFYWQACWPGCLPDGDPMGPFASEQEAIDDANEHA